jgi:predicted transcriptional regulator
VFEAAERLAEQRGIPRSRLYAEALRDYLAREGSQAVTAKLDEVYADGAEPLDPAFMRAQLDVIDDAAW